MAPHFAGQRNRKVVPTAALPPSELVSPSCSHGQGMLNGTGTILRRDPPGSHCLHDAGVVSWRSMSNRRTT
eukprot:2202218-Alexandrium_andersonii.AAC.1